LKGVGLKAVRKAFTQRKVCFKQGRHLDSHCGHPDAILDAPERRNGKWRLQHGRRSIHQKRVKKFFRQIKIELLYAATRSLDGLKPHEKEVFWKARRRVGLIILHELNAETIPFEGKISRKTSAGARSTLSITATEKDGINSRDMKEAAKIRQLENFLVEYKRPSFFLEKRKWHQRGL